MCSRLVRVRLLTDNAFQRNAPFRCRLTTVTVAPLRCDRFLFPIGIARALHAIFIRLNDR